MEGSEGSTNEAEALKKELEDAKAEIARLKEQLATRDRRTDVFQSIVEFRESLLDRLDLSSLQQSAQQLQATLRRPVVPRRKRQAFAAALPFATLPLAYLLTLALIWIAIFRDPTRLVAAFLVLYFGHIALDSSSERGSQPRAWLKGHWMWRHMADYFPVELRKMNPETPFPAEATYLFGYHPHGIISVGCFVNFATSATGFPGLFPGLDIRLGTLGFNLKIPFFREWLLRMGIISVSAPSIRHVLQRGPGAAVVIVPGGAAESLDARPGANDLTLQRRNGFFRIALQHGVQLVPVYSFGENELYEVPTTARLRWLQETMMRWVGYTMPIYMGAGCASTAAQATPLNPVPRRHPVITIVGDPIPCERVVDPTQEQIDTLKSRYIERLKEIFDRFADQYAPSRQGNLRIVS